MWNNRNVWILMSGELVAGLALWFGLIGNLEFLQLNVPSDLAKAAILMFGPLTAVLFGPLAGRVVDAYEKKPVMIISGIVRILAVLFMFIALKTDSVLWMIGYQIVIGVSAAFYFPALQALIPLIVKEDQLISANGLYMNVSTFARIIGTAIAGLLLLVMSLHALYLLTLIAYAAILIFTFLLRIEEKVDRAEDIPGRSKAKGSFKEVLPLVKDNPVVLMALMLTLVPSIFIGSFNLMVISISEIQADNSIKGLLYTVEGIAFMLGAALAKRVSAGRNLLSVLIGLSFVIALSEIALYAAEFKWAALLGFGLFGLGAGAFFPLTATLYQRSVPKEFHGRFFSFRGMLDRVLFQTTMLCTGLFLDTIGYKWMVALYALIGVLLVAYYRLKQMRKPLYYQEEQQKATL